MKKSLIVAVCAITLAGALVYGGTVANAQAQPSNGSSLVQKIADKFGLKLADVQSVFDEERQLHEQEHVAKMEERLSTLVTEGKITEAQKNAIVAKQKELQTNRQANFEAMKNMTKEERKTAMDKEKTELEAWAKSQGIDSTVFPMFGMHGGRGMKGGFRK